MCVLDVLVCFLFLVVYFVAFFVLSNKNKEKRTGLWCNNTNKKASLFYWIKSVGKALFTAETFDHLTSVVLIFVVL